jgi:hypothetical protein
MRQWFEDGQVYGSSVPVIKHGLGANEFDFYAGTYSGVGMLS